jgi:ribonuclease D
MAGMESVLESAVIWVDQDTALAETLQTLKQEEQVAVDTESNSLFAYQEQVCLIQISAGGEDYVLDGLADMDLPALEAIFADESIEKIFHAAEYDIMCLKRDFGYTFHNLFDTMQAARILGIEKLGLSNLLEDLFGVDQGKSFQKANWGKRPLTEEMLYYARMDTHYLVRLRNYLYQKLEEKDLLELAHEDFERLCRVEPNHKEALCYSQVSGYQHLDPQQLSVLEALCQFRDKLARKFNRPLFKVIGNSALLAAEYQGNFPKTGRALRRGIDGSRSTRNESTANPTQNTQTPFLLILKQAGRHERAAQKSRPANGRTIRHHPSTRYPGRHRRSQASQSRGASNAHG